MSIRGYLVALTAGCLLTSASAHANIIPTGSTLNLYLTNFAGCADAECTSNLTFGSTNTINNGEVTQTTSEVSTGPTGAWDIFSFTTTDGSPIAGDINGNWQIEMDYTLSAAVNFDQVVNQWLVAGSPVTPTGSIGGICCAVSTNPILPGGGFYGSGFTSPLPAGLSTSWDQIYVDPYSFVTSGGIPTDADEFQFALHFTLQSPVPEPSTWAMMALGFAGLGFAGYRRRAQSARVAA
jgi:PEP-CTERM motif